MMVRSSTLALLLALSTVAPSSEAFRNGNNPQVKTATATTTTTTTAPGPKISEPPMPFKWPIVGTLPDFIFRGGVDAMKDVHESMYKEYGPVYGMSIMGDDEIVVADPRIFDEAQKKEGRFPIGGAENAVGLADYYKNNDMEFAQASMGRGPEWKKWRQSVNPDIYVQWGTYLPAIADACSKISKVAGREVTETQNLHISDFLSRASFDMFSSVLYGESPETTDTNKATKEDVSFVKATKRAFDITGALITNPADKLFGGELLKELNTNMDETRAHAEKRGLKMILSASENKALYEANQQQEEVQRNELQAKVQGENEDNSASDSASGCPITAMKETLSGKKVEIKRDNFIPTDFLSPSYIERLVNRGNLSIETIKELQVPMLMAGVDTTAYAMSWFYLNMASNPQIQTKLANELHETLRGADVTTVEQMESLSYLSACFRESHRLTPTVPISLKKFEQDIDFVVDDKSFKVPAGQKISLNLRGLPMDPNLVENPTEFVPERFSPDAVEMRKGTPSGLALDHPFFNDPFGRGKRRCIGANVAIAEMTLLAARLLQDWEISLVDPGEAVDSPTKSWQSKQKLMQIADPYPAMRLTPRKRP